MIHYHGMSAGGGSLKDAFALATGSHVFVSFASALKLPALAQICSTFALDNGAYRAWRKGEEFNWGDYLEFVKQWRRHPACDWHVIPDVIDGSERENDDWIRKWPKDLGGVPVWHLHESLDRLVRLAEDFPRVALGSSGDFSAVGTVAWWSRMEQAMEKVCDSHGRPKVKLHGMRMLDWRIFTRLPLSSADSTSAYQHGRPDKRQPSSFPFIPPSRGQRSRVWAWITESHQSAETWVPDPQEEFNLRLKA